MLLHRSQGRAVCASIHNSEVHQRCHIERHPDLLAHRRFAAATLHRAALLPAPPARAGLPALPASVSPLTTCSSAATAGTRQPNSSVAPPSRIATIMGTCREGTLHIAGISMVWPCTPMALAMASRGDGPLVGWDLGGGVLLPGAEPEFDGAGFCAGF